MEDGALAPFEDFEGRKSVLTVETAGADALDHHTLAEAKRRPHRSSCETMEEEPATLKTAGIDHDATYAAVAYFAAKPGPAHWEAFKRISPQSLWHTRPTIHARRGKQPTRGRCKRERQRG